jgi:sortase A
MSKFSSQKRKPRPESKKKKTKELAGTRVKISFKKHLMPPLVGLFVAVAIFGFFNSGWLSARIEYYLASHSQQVIYKPPANKIDKNAPAKLYIDKIHVETPVIFNVKTVDQNLFLQALHNGVVHYPDTANPGQRGNVVVFGHSSGQWWAPGDYKFVFTLLDKLQVDDKIVIDYQGVRYIYRMYAYKIVEPTDLSVLNQGNDNTLTLITCTPVGTSAKRLIIIAKQIVPDVKEPTEVNQAAQLPDQAQGKLPGNSGSFWRNFKERLF